MGTSLQVTGFFDDDGVSSISVILLKHLKIYILYRVCLTVIMVLAGMFAFALKSCVMFALVKSEISLCDS